MNRQLQAFRDLKSIADSPDMKMLLIFNVDKVYFNEPDVYPISDKLEELGMNESADFLRCIFQKRTPTDDWVVWINEDGRVGGRSDTFKWEGVSLPSSRWITYESQD